MAGLPKAEWVWMPHAAHLIVGHDCRFHLATYVGDHIVSTVGEYDPDITVKRITAETSDLAWHLKNAHLRGDEFRAAFHSRFGWQEIGAGRTYETMVFRATSGSGCGCQWVQADGMELDFAGYNDPEAAFAGHMSLCEKWAAIEGEAT